MDYKSFYTHSWYTSALTENDRTIQPMHPFLSMALRFMVRDTRDSAMGPKSYVRKGQSVKKRGSDGRVRVVCPMIPGRRILCAVATKRTRAAFFWALSAIV